MHGIYFLAKGREREGGGAVLFNIFAKIIQKEW